MLWLLKFASVFDEMRRKMLADFGRQYGLTADEVEDILHMLRDRTQFKHNLIDALNELYKGKSYHELAPYMQDAIKACKVLNPEMYEKIMAAIRKPPGIRRMIAAQLLRRFPRIITSTISNPAGLGKYNK